MASRLLAQSEVVDLLQYALDHKVEIIKRDVLTPPRYEVQSICNELHVWAEYEAVYEFGRGYYMLRFSKQVNPDHLEVFAQFFTPDIFINDYHYSCKPEEEE